MGTYRSICYEIYGEDSQDVEHAWEEINKEGGIYFRHGQWSSDTKWYNGDALAKEVSDKFCNVVIRHRESGGCKTDDLYFRGMVVPFEKLISVNYQQLSYLIPSAHESVLKEKEEAEKVALAKKLAEQDAALKKERIKANALNKLTQEELQILIEDILLPHAAAVGKIKDILWTQLNLYGGLKDF